MPSMPRRIGESVDRAHYQADTCLVWCFDDRFSELLGKFIADQRFRHADLIKVAGGAKDLASPTNTADRIYLLGQIEKSMRLHRPKSVSLMVHADCGAYGGLAFESDAAEREFFESELAKAEAAVRELLTRLGAALPIQKYFADFSGLTRLH